jgi:hypothetical protein
MAQDNLDPDPLDEAVELPESSPDTFTDPPGGGGGTGGIATPTAPVSLTDPPGGGGGTGG